MRISIVFFKTKNKKQTEEKRTKLCRDLKLVIARGGKKKEKTIWIDGGRKVAVNNSFL